MSGTNEITIASPIFEAFERNIVSVTSPSPLPPGSRVKLPLPAKNNSRVDVRGKVIAINSAKTGKYAIEIRLHSLTKEHEILLRAASKPTST